MARVAIVTGGTRGIGEAISIALRDQGMKVAANYAGNEERARAFTERTGIPAFKWDVSDFDACQAGVKQVEEEVGPVDVLVNNAGITRDTTMKRMDHQKWQEVMDTNLGGCFNMAKAVWEGMTGRGYGRIVNIASEAGRVGSKGSAAYSAAKAGLIGFTKAIARESARYGVTANAIAPGPIETPLLMGAKEFGEIGEKVIETMKSSTQMGRLGQPDEVAAAVAFLASDDASYVTGETLGVSGGLGMV